MAKWNLNKLEQPSPEAIDAHTLVRAALERAADCCEVGPSDEWSEETRHGYLFGAGDCQRNIVALASDPAEVAAIISAAAQLKNAEGYGG